MIIRPTLADLALLNRRALRRLERLAQRSESKGARFVDRLGRIINAEPVHFPWYVRVTNNKGNYHPDHHSVPERPYSFGKFNLNRNELELILGLDYNPPGPLTLGTSVEDLNAMWKVHQSCPSNDANAYLLGLFFHDGSSSSPDCIVPVQYYRIDPQKHRELQLPKQKLKELMEYNETLSLQRTERK